MNNPFSCMFDIEFIFTPFCICKKWDVQYNRVIRTRFFVYIFGVRIFTLSLADK